MRKRIDENYVAAVRQAAEALGGQSDLARAAGVPPGTICAILSPKRNRRFVLSSVYNRLYPFVSPYLPAQPEIPIGPALPPPPVPVVNPYYVNNINNNVNTAGPAPAVSIPKGSIPAEVILHAMQGMDPEEKARFLKELYTDCSHETDNNETTE